MMRKKIAAKIEVVDAPKARALDACNTLFEGIGKRPRPEDVAKLIDTFAASHVLELTPAEKKVLKKASEHAGRASYMSDEFEFVDMSRQLGVAEALFPILRKPGPADSKAITAYLRVAGSTIGKKFGANDFMHERLNKGERKTYGVEINRRQYNKRFRFLRRAEAKLKVMERELQKNFFALASKSKLACKIEKHEFVKDADTACFIAYFAARCCLRSEFAVKHQERPFDEVSEMLLSRCKASKTTNWWAIAHAHPVPEVLKHLDDRQRGKLLGRWFSVLNDLSSLMAEVWGSGVDKKTMIVRRGNDSTTWNAMAGAWNKSRDAWINLLYSMGLESVLEELCPGKVLRLMAADVAYMHRQYGDGLDPDTAVWADLPLPWEVLSGKESCTRAQVAAVCKKHGIDPEKSAWTAPRPKGAPAETKPTPELVHGIAIADPAVAKMLRSAGVFSGKPGRADPWVIGNKEAVIVNEAREAVAEKLESDTKKEKEKGLTS